MKKKKILAFILVLMTLLFFAVGCQKITDEDTTNPDYNSLTANQFVIAGTVYDLPTSIYNLPVTKCVTGECEYKVNGVEFCFNTIKYYPLPKDNGDGTTTDSYEYIYFAVDENSNIQCVHLNHPQIKNGGDTYHIAGLTVGMSRDEVIYLKGEGFSKRYSGYGGETDITNLTYYQEEYVTLAVEYDTVDCVKSITAIYGNARPEIK